MTDKEMLEFAARAEGYARMVYRDDVPYVSLDMNGDDFVAWNPRTSSGDNFDLAAKLGISIEHDASIQVDYSDEMGGEYALGVHAWVVKDDLIEAKEIYGDDRCDTARLAVLRVAAEIGKRI